MKKISTAPEITEQCKKEAWEYQVQHLWFQLAVAYTKNPSRFKQTCNDYCNSVVDEYVQRFKNG